jgi:hypothetical protein
VRTSPIEKHLAGLPKTPQNGDMPSQDQIRPHRNPLFADLKVSELPIRVQKRFKNCEDATPGEVLASFTAMIRGDAVAARRVRETIEGDATGRFPSECLRKLYAAFADIKIDELPPRVNRRLRTYKGATLAEAAVLGMWLSASSGNVDAMREIREAIEGTSA